jgi:N-hydroxyarylamine O-acetyltransferase
MYGIHHTLSIENYLKRINYNGDLSVSYDTLSQLMYCHFTSVPYENLDILNQIPLSLEIPVIYDKIVNRRRGGYCFELNGLFNWLLNEVGFQTESFLGRFLVNESVAIPIRRHRVMKTEIEGIAYIADVGVGVEVPLYPLQLVENKETEIRGILYRFRKDELLGWVLQHRNVKKNDFEWRDIYGITEANQYEIDFVQPNYWCQYSPDSPLNQLPKIALRTKSGKYAIDGTIFRIYDITGAQLKITEKIFESSELNGILSDYFGIVL